MHSDISFLWPRRTANHQLEGQGVKELLTAVLQDMVKDISGKCLGIHDRPSGSLHAAALTWRSLRTTTKGQHHGEETREPPIGRKFGVSLARGGNLQGSQSRCNMR